MKFLLFLLGVVFFFIFFLFSNIPEIEGFFIPSLFFTANIYVLVVIVIIFLLIASSTSKKSMKYDEDETSETFGKKYIPSNSEIREFIVDFFSSYIYYIACALFYGALYVILQSFFSTLDIALFFLILNAVVISLYFLEHKVKVFQDFVRVNLILISFYYILVHTVYLLGFDYEYHIFDIVNIFGVFLLFGILLKSKRAEKYSQILKHYFIAFTFLEISTFYKIIFSGELLSLGIIFGLSGVILLIFTNKIHDIFLLPKAILRFWGVIFSCIFILISLFHLGSEDMYVLFLIPTLGIVAKILFLFHERFQNYVALLFALLGLIGSGYGIYSIILGEKLESYYLTVFYFFFSGLILFFHKTSNTLSQHDRYFFHTLSLLVNLVGVFYFFYFRDFSILALGILLLGESVYLFFSYYTITKTKHVG